MWLDDLTSLKTTWTTGKNIVWRKKIKTTFFLYIYWDNNIFDPGLTFQIHDPGHETMITPNKTNYEV
jgi:hypothetical protein